MARAPIPTTDPSRDAAALLRRLGFAVLTIGLPFAALLSRRGVVLLLPIGAVLLIVAAGLESGFHRLRDNAGRLRDSSAFLLTTFALVWATVSLAWSADASAGGSRLFGAFGMLALGFGAYLALPERMRAANLYLVPIGTALAGASALAITLAGQPQELDDDGRSLERGLAVLVLFLWPALAWLRSRGRDLEAGCLAVSVAVAVLVAPGPAHKMALGAGAASFVVATISSAGVGLVAAALAAGIAAAPLLPLALAPVAGAVGLGTWSPALQTWGSIVTGEPWRLLTGRGYGALLRDRLSGTLPPSTPDTVLLQIWYELGLVGALTAATILWVGLRSAGGNYPRLMPGLVAAVAAAYALAVGGMGIGQPWWPGALVVLALIFVGAERSQFSTRRPRAAIRPSAPVRA
jgi:hypothetical protein